MLFFKKLIEYQKRKMIKNFDEAVNHVKLGLYHSLKNDMIKKYDENYSGLMAASVTNEIFGLAATTQEAQKFSASNKKAIETEIRNLKDKKELIEILNICLRLRAKIIYENISSGTNLKISGKAIDNLRKHGLLLDNITLPTTSKFVRDAKSFLRKAMNIAW